MSTYCGALRIGFELLPQLAHQNPEMLVLRLAGSAPDPLRKHLVREHAPTVCREQAEQTEFPGREPDLDIASIQPALVEIDDEIAPPDRPAQLLPNRSTQPGSNARDELLGTEGFGDVVVRAGIQRMNLGRFLATNRKHDDGHVGKGAKLAAHRDAVHVGKAKIDDDEVRMIAIEARESVRAGTGDRYRIAARSQQRGRGPLNRRLVVDEKNGLGAHATSKVTSAIGRVVVGTSSVNTAPPAGSFAAEIRPPCCSSSPRAMARPMPLPNVS